MNARPAGQERGSEELHTPSEILGRLFMWLLGTCVAYPFYLLLLGPYLALCGTGGLDFLPRGIREAPFYPAMPVYSVHGLRGTYDAYLDWWYEDPNEADPPTGWY